MTLSMLCPTRGRPQQAAELAVLWPDVTESAELTFVLDDDDPALPQYQAILRGSGYGLVVTDLATRGMVLRLNAAATAAAAACDHVGFLGDDHRPRTPGWDRLLTDALGGRPGVAYGDDLAQGQQLPTACVIDSRIVRALGWMAPPALHHLFADNFWHLLGRNVGNLAWQPAAVIEHMHPAAGKGRWDEQYRALNAPGHYQGEAAAYRLFLSIEWPGHLDRLRRTLGHA